MAINHLGINRGQYYNQVIIGTSALNTDVELLWNNAKNMTREDVLQGIEKIKLTIMDGYTLFNDNNG